MPLPITKERIYFVDKDGNQRTDATFLNKDTGYKPTREYYPTMRAGKCSKCGAVGCIAFKKGFNLKLGDRVMAGKPIPGECPRCGKGTEFVPLPVDAPENKEISLYYHIQKSLDAYVERGMEIDARFALQPAGRIKRWEDYVRRKESGQA